MELFNLIVKKAKDDVLTTSRCLFAISSLSLLLFNDIYELIPFEYYTQLKNTISYSKYNFFLIFSYDSIWLSKLIACGLLMFVISGYLPQISCILHFWIAFSIFNSILTIEGGDQIAAIILFFILPVGVFDKRISIWSNKNIIEYRMPEFVYYFCYSCIIIVRIQASLLYFDSGIEKLKVEEWIDGSSTYYWFNHNIFGATDWLKYIFGWIFINPLFVTLVTWGVIFLEIMLAAAIFMEIKYKRVLLVVAIVFHFTIFLVHGLPHFFLNMLALLCLYLLPVKLYLNENNVNVSRWKLQ